MRLGSAGYSRHHNLCAGLDALDLWELPWMKPELEEHRHGYSWQDRFRFKP